MANPTNICRYLRSFTAVTSHQSCFLHTTTGLAKGNTRRLIAASGSGGGASSKATSRRESVAQMKAAASRARWEAEMKEAARLKGLRPDPQLSVYFASSFEAKQWSLCDAITALREAAAPEMFNCLDNPLYARVVLNMRTKKSNKQVSKFEGTTTLPHLLDFLPKRRIIVLTNDSALAQECTGELGALAAGGMDVIGRLDTGGFHWDEYDDVVAHQDFSEAILKVRKILQQRLPSTKNGRMGEDVKSMLLAQQVCTLMNSDPIDGVPEINHLSLVLGQLSWDTDRLAENLVCYLNTIEKEKSTRIHGDAFEKIEITCAPCDESFLIDPDSLLKGEGKQKQQIATA